MKINFEYFTALQYEVKALRAQVKAYKSGEAFLRQQDAYEKRLREKDRIIKALKEELADAHKETVTVRNNWMQVFEDMEKQHRIELEKEQRNTSRMTKRAQEAEAKRDEWRKKWRAKQQELYAVQTELESQKELNKKLTAQVLRSILFDAIICRFRQIKNIPFSALL